MKRTLDIVASGFAIVILLPLIVAITLLVRWRLGSPVLFRQTHHGKYARPLEMLKFRTMTDARDGEGRLLPDVDRLTPFGRFLRSISLDELPELWNVLKGDMSLVGPRPPLMEYLPLYSPEQTRRHEIRPGLTGWAQVNGRNELSWEKKIALDVWYVNNQSFWLVIQIIVRTIGSVLKRSGISAEGEATMPRFSGMQSKKGNSA